MRTAIEKSQCKGSFANNVGFLAFRVLFTIDENRIKEMETKIENQKEKPCKKGPKYVHVQSKKVPIVHSEKLLTTKSSREIQLSPNAIPI